MEISNFPRNVKSFVRFSPLPWLCKAAEERLPFWWNTSGPVNITVEGCERSRFNGALEKFAKHEPSESNGMSQFGELETTNVAFEERSFGSTFVNSFWICLNGIVVVSIFMIQLSEASSQIKWSNLRWSICNQLWLPEAYCVADAFAWKRRVHDALLAYVRGWKTFRIQNK